MYPDGAPTGGPFGAKEAATGKVAAVTPTAVAALGTLVLQAARRAQAMITVTSVHFMRKCSADA